MPTTTAPPPNDTGTGPGVTPDPATGPTAAQILADSTVRGADSSVSLRTVGNAQRDASTSTSGEPLVDFTVTAGPDDDDVSRISSFFADNDQDEDKKKRAQTEHGE